MPEMPTRPREHVLGDEAPEAFKRILPSEWIYRAKTSDYGVDGEVELVSPHGALTGRLFYVQLKGTDIESLKDALAIRLNHNCELLPCVGSPCAPCPISCSDEALVCTVV
jgi:hypothetical protein